MTNVSVNIKMYRVGELGDCFLLRFTNGDEQSNVLIDCGSFNNYPVSKARIKKVVADIQAQIGVHKLNLVAGTHQHNDHLSGFVHEEAVFRKIDIDQVCLSWLDNPDDGQATENGKLYNNFLKQLQSIRLKLNSMDALSAIETTKKLDDILAFSGVDMTSLNAAGKKKFPPALPSQAISILRSLGKQKPKYLDQGEVFDLPGLAPNTVRIYVLGPPRNEDLLYDIKPDKTETFDPELAMTGSQAEKFLLALNSNVRYNKVVPTEDEPFPFYEADSDSKDLDVIMKKYDRKHEEWRRIDEEWLKQSERLGLWLNTYTNNSSLVLAFELVKSNKVLLFAADAQTGNWNSWKEIKWEKMPKGFNWKNLLEKTVFYKVGHHGSHNATLVDGLNAMVHDDLVAMIPVDRSDSHVAKNSFSDGWKMPAANLYANLKQKTKYRLLRMDDGFADQCNPTNKKVKDSWNGLHIPTVKELYIEYDIDG